MVDSHCERDDSGEVLVTERMRKAGALALSDFRAGKIARGGPAVTEALVERVYVAMARQNPSQ
jgi:hypothetical protein